MASPELTEWLEAANRVPRISAAQEIMLARVIQHAIGTSDERLKQRGLKAQQRLATANLRLVWCVVMGSPKRPSSYRRSVPDHQLADLLQVGAEGVFHAASKFDPEAGYKFSTYAAIWIRERCQKELDRMIRPIRAPTTLANAVRRFDRVRAALGQGLGRQPTVEELATELQVSESEVRLMAERLQPVASLDQICGDGDCSLEDLIAAPLQGVEGRASRTNRGRARKKERMKQLLLPLRVGVEVLGTALSVEDAY